MTAPVFDPAPAPEHRTEVRREDVPVYGWYCQACGERGEGFTLLRFAEEDADRHEANT